MRSALFSLLVSAAALGLMACQADTEKLTSHMQRADEYAEAEQWSEAIIEYKNVLQIDPNLADAHFGLAKAYLQSGRTREGFWELRETVRLDPDNLPAKIQFGQISLLAGELEEALKHASDVVEKEPQRVRGQLLKALALETLGRPEEALEVYKTALEVAPEDRNALISLANHYRRRGRPDEAEPLYEKLVEVSPTSNSYSLLAGFLSQDRFQDEKSEAAYRKALELAETHEERGSAYNQLASFLFSRDRFDESVEVLQSGIQQFQDQGEDSLDMIYLLARFYRGQGDNERADALIEEATQASPDDPRPYLILSAYQSRKGDPAGALESARKAMELDPTSNAARLRVAEMLVEIGHDEDSEEMLAEGRSIVDAILAVEPSNAGALFVKGKIQLASGQVEEAIATLRAGINARPDWAQAHFVLGAALAFSGDRAAARGELARALEIDAGLLEAHRVLCGVHFSLREYEYAVDAGRRYLREVPDDAATRILVAQSLVRLGELEEALEELKAIPEEKTNAEVLYAFGRIHMSRKEYGAARRYLLAADTARPGSPEILRSLYSLDRLQNRYKESYERIRAAINANPEDHRLYRLQGILALDAGRTGDAERHLQKALELDPEDIRNYELLARLYATTGRTEETIKTYEKAREMQPDSGSVNHFLGVLYEMAGQRELAIERYEDAIRNDPNLAEPRNNLAYLFAEEGVNLDRALDLAQEAKALLPDNPNTADTLGWVLFKRGIPSAAISYLREAEAASDPTDGTLGIVRHHLALAYEANGEPDQARETLQRALTALEASAAEREAGGKSARPEPSWATEVRAMLRRLGGPTGSIQEASTEG